nr:HAD family hydrolase [uncultured Cellulosilyticum sp.]
MKKGIIFDLDGTLWDSSKQVVEAWNRALAKHPELKKQISLKEIQGFMGRTMPQIAALMFPDMAEEKRAAILDECCDEEQVYLLKHGGILYPYLEEVLGRLKDKYGLYIVSNSQDGYVQAFLEYHHMSSYFEDYEMAGRTGKCKGENIKLVMERNNLEQAVYMGDTQGDLDAADLAGIPFILADYGFGSVDRKTYTVEKFSDLEELIGHIL